MTILLCIVAFSLVLLGEVRVCAHGGLRRLSEEHFISYEPATTVTDDAAIDLDLRDLTLELALRTPEGREAAWNIYTQGSYSKSYAKLTLEDSEGFLVDVPQDTIVVGQTLDGTQVLGKVRKTVNPGETSIDFQYHASTIQSKWTNCHVGGNPHPNLDGCLAPNGTIEIDDLGIFSYTYNPTKDNLNARTLQSLSTKAQEKMLDCQDGCPYPTFLKFFEYYGVADYGDRWIRAAFNKTITNFVRGNARFEDFIEEKEEGATEAIIQGVVVLNIWMYVNRELEHAAATCLSAQNCAGDDCSNQDRIHAWDKAVAFYTGSGAKTGQSAGYLLYTLAQNRCFNFGTCLTSAQELGRANVNSAIFNAFEQGKQALVTNNCPAVVANVERITKQMTIPLIQSLLRFAYHQANPAVHNINQAKTEAEGGTFAAALLPMINACSKVDAMLIYDNMKVGNGGTTDFQAVKAALERNYDCLGVTCSDVGGLVDMARRSEYLDGAEPCGYVKPDEGTSIGTSSSAGTSEISAGDGNEPKPNLGLAIGLTIFIMFVLLTITIILTTCQQKEDLELKPVETDLT